jgi:single-stranded DNA-binding protein
MFNSTITGNLAKDAEYKKAGAYDVAEFTVAVSHGKDKTSFIDCQVWGKRWELIVDAYKKGSLVAVSGEGFYSTYETEDGQKRKFLRVNVSNFVLPEKRESANIQEETATIPF